MADADHVRNMLQSLKGIVLLLKVTWIITRYYTTLGVKSRIRSNVPEDSIKISGKKSCISSIWAYCSWTLQMEVSADLTNINSIHGEAQRCNPVFDYTKKFVLKFVLRNERRDLTSLLYLTVFILITLHTCPTLENRPVTSAPNENLVNPVPK